MTYYTENLSDFGFREIKMLRDILNAWIENGLPNGFDNDRVRPAMNTSSGYVFLVNDEYQTAMINDTELELFHSLPYSGKEGFLSDLLKENAPQDMVSDDVEYLLNAADIADFNLKSLWLEFKQSLEL